MAAEPEEETVVTDRAGVIRHWGRGWQDTLGYTPEDAQGRKVDLIVPPALRERHWRGFHNAIEMRRLRHGDDNGRWTLKTVAVHKSGKLVALRATLELTHAEGAVSGAKGTLLGPGPAWTASAARVLFAVLELVRVVGRRFRTGP